MNCLWWSCNRPQTSELRSPSLSWWSHEKETAEAQNKPRVDPHRTRLPHPTLPETIVFTMAHNDRLPGKGSLLNRPMTSPLSFSYRKSLFVGRLVMWTDSGEKTVRFGQPSQPLPQWEGVDARKGGHKDPLSRLNYCLTREPVRETTILWSRQTMNACSSASGLTSRRLLVKDVPKFGLPTWGLSLIPSPETAVISREAGTMLPLRWLLQRSNTLVRFRATGLTTKFFLRRQPRGQPSMGRAARLTWTDDTTTASLVSSLCHNRKLSKPRYCRSRPDTDERDRIVCHELRASWKHGIE
ncbi:hypothetical protein RRG08_025903 [Elysia crispata]|uniref:Uncharacterized protein n=1 Tax=Elysia crispata TaxID=231223 RepID=A0AAE1AIV9_9GAST|nr:hypothetical protein RRG08_025903 [Elysia crispata]